MEWSCGGAMGLISGLGEIDPGALAWICLPAVNRSGVNQSPNVGLGGERVPSHLHTQRTSQTDQQPEMAKIVAVAADLTCRIFDADPDRLRHSQAIALQAEFFSLTVDPASAP